MWGQRSYHPIGPALRLYIVMPPFVRHRVAHAHVLDVHVTSDVRTRFEEYRVAIKCRDESRHVTYGKTYTLPIKFWKDPSVGLPHALAMIFLTKLIFGVYFL